MPIFNNTDDTQNNTNTEPTVEQTVEPVVEEEQNLPSIELIIEDGSGVPNANAYCDLDYALEYCTMKGYTDWQKLTDDEQKIFIIRGTEFVNNYYTWKGVRRFLNQDMAFPRDDLYDLDHYRVVGVPEVLKKACLEAAWLNATSGSDTLFINKDANGKVKRQKVDTLEVEYFNDESSSSSSSSTEVDYTSIYDVLNKMLKGLYKTGNAGRVCTRAVYTGW